MFHYKFSKFHKQAQKAGLPPPPEVTDTTDTKLLSRQFMITTAAAQENADNAKAADDASHKMSEDQVNKLSDQLKGQLVRNSSDKNIWLELRYFQANT